MMAAIKMTKYRVTLVQMHEIVHEGFAVDEADAIRIATRAHPLQAVEDNHYRAEVVSVEEIA